MGKLLSNEETKLAIKLWQEKHDENAFQLLLESNHGLISKAINDFLFKEYEDVKATAYEGFVSALNYFDLSKPIYNFYNYVYRCIRQKLFTEFVDRQYSIDAPLSLDLPPIEDADIDLYNLLEGPNNIDDFIYYTSLDKTLHDELAKLKPRERDYIIKKYGLFNHKPMLEEEIAKEVNYSRSMINKVLKQGTIKLRESKELKSLVR
jgi:RNA polymerase sigma factor (sigma-70 family)